MRLPVAWKTALAMAAATPTIPISPIPLTPIGLTPVGFADEDDLDVGDVGVDRHEVIGEVGVGDAAGAASVTVSSNSAMPMPPTVPPMIWLRAVFALRIGRRRSPS